MIGLFFGLITGPAPYPWFMNENLPEYSVILINAFNRLRLGNPEYSLRKFARDINIHPAVLSLAMKGKRFLAPNDVDAAIKFLELDSDDLIKFMKSTLFKVYN